MGKKIASTRLQTSQFYHKSALIYLYLHTTKYILIIFGSVFPLNMLPSCYAKNKQTNKKPTSLSFPPWPAAVTSQTPHATLNIRKNIYNPNFPTQPDNLTFTPLTMSMSDGVIQTSHYFQINIYRVNPSGSLCYIWLILTDSHCLHAQSCRMYEMGPGILNSDRIWEPPSSARHKESRIHCSSKPSDAKSLPKFQSRNAWVFLDWEPNKLLMIIGIKATTTMFK